MWLKQYISNVIANINNDIHEHKKLEMIKFWKNFSVWDHLLYESNNWGYHEWYFSWLVENIENNIRVYYYRVMNKATGNVELCPIYNISGYIYK